MFLFKSSHLIIQLVAALTIAPRNTLSHPFLYGPCELGVVICEDVDNCIENADTSAQASFEACDNACLESSSCDYFLFVLGGTATVNCALWSSAGASFKDMARLPDLPIMVTGYQGCSSLTTAVLECVTQADDQTQCYEMPPDDTTLCSPNDSGFRFEIECDGSCRGATVNVVIDRVDGELTAAMVTDSTEQFDLGLCFLTFEGYCGTLVITKDVTSFTLLVTFETGASATGKVRAITTSVKAVVTSMTLDERCG